VLKSSRLDKVNDIGWPAKNGIKVEAKGVIVVFSTDLVKPVDEVAFQLLEERTDSLQHKLLRCTILELGLRFLWKWPIDRPRSCRRRVKRGRDAIDVEEVARRG